MWQTDKTDTRLFCGLLRKIWLRIAIATEKKTMKLLKDEAPEKNQWNDAIPLFIDLAYNPGTQIAISPLIQAPSSH